MSFSTRLPGEGVVHKRFATSTWAMNKVHASQFMLICIADCIESLQLLPIQPWSVSSGVSGKSCTFSIILVMNFNELILASIVAILCVAANRVREIRSQIVNMTTCSSDNLFNEVEPVIIDIII
jgi:hypothetical protein